MESDAKPWNPAEIGAVFRNDLIAAARNDIDGVVRKIDRIARSNGDGVPRNNRYLVAKDDGTQSPGQRRYGCAINKSRYVNLS